MALAMSERGVREGDSVAVMCRNHRGFIDASIAVAKLGADILYLNTAFAGPQLVDVLEREAPSMVIHDEEFTALLAGARVERRVLAWTDDDPGPGGDPQADVAPGDEEDRQRDDGAGDAVGAGGLGQRPVGQQDHAGDEAGQHGVGDAGDPFEEPAAGVDARAHGLAALVAQDRIDAARRADDRLNATAELFDDATDLGELFGSEAGAFRDDHGNGKGR